MKSSNLSDCLISLLCPHSPADGQYDLTIRNIHAGLIICVPFAQRGSNLWIFPYKYMYVVCTTAISYKSCTLCSAENSMRW